jgi:hypothetical protein
MFDYEISKRAMIHMDFIEHFSKYYDFLEIVSIKRHHHFIWVKK